MYYLIAGSLIFFGVHFYSAFRTRIPGKDIREKMGSGRYMASYGLMSIIGFALMVWGYSLSRPSPELFSPPTWGRLVPYILMLPAFILLASAYVPRGYIKQYSKHPMLLATILWSFSHLLANGEVNSAILFGGFLAFSLVDRISVMNRPEPIQKISTTSDVISVIVGIIAYGATLQFLHPVLIGVAV